MTRFSFLHPGIICFLAGVAILLSPRLTSPAIAQQPVPLTQQPSQSNTPDPLRSKLDYLQQNGKRSNPDPRPTTISEDEVNAHFSRPDTKLPRGVKSVHFSSSPGMITAVAIVDFDEIRNGKPGNALLNLFQGQHEVNAVARANGTHFHGEVDIVSVLLDGVEVPGFLLEIFAQKYVAPRYPGVGLETRFVMPARVETAIIGHHRLTLTQR